MLLVTVSCQKRIATGDAALDNVPAIAITDNTHKDRIVTVPTFTSSASVVETRSAFKLPVMFSDNCLLQANKACRIWGECTDVGKMAVEITDAVGKSAMYYGEVGADRYFEIFFLGADYGEGYTLRLITESGKSRTLSDVAFGELFIAGGQSNMGWTVGICYNKTAGENKYQEDINTASNTAIRYLAIHPVSSKTQREELYEGEEVVATGWSHAEPTTVIHYSACAYFFCREFNKMYNVPVGIIQSCMGATYIYTWMPPEAYEKSYKQQNLPDTPSFRGSEFFNAMIYPLRKMTVRGFLWYQGEGDYKHYAENEVLLVEGWRALFEDDGLFWGDVQLPRYIHSTYGDWFLCREEHKKACAALSNATYSVNIDLGLLPQDIAVGDESNPQPIHPYDKKPVGQRLCYAMMQQFYGASGVWRGPVYKSSKLKDGIITVSFDNVGAGICLYGAGGFEVAGSDSVFLPATPVYADGRTITLDCQQVENPVYIRYGYSNESSLTGSVEHFKDIAESVCVYNTKGTDAVKAFPLEQFAVKIGE